MRVQGIDRLRVSRQLLQTPESPDALAKGALAVWSAMFDIEDWPHRLQSQALSLQFSMFRYGTISMTVQQMSDCERQLFREELLELIDLAEQFDPEPAAQQPEV